MGNIRYTRRLLSRWIAVTIVAVVPGMGMAPAGAADGMEEIGFEAAFIDLRTDIDTGHDNLRAEVGAGLGVNGETGLRAKGAAVAGSRVTHTGVTFKINDIKG